MKTGTIITLLASICRVIESGKLKLIRDTCHHVYGIPLDVVTELNFLQCSKTCVEYNDDVCQSVLYDPKTRSCMLNGEMQLNEDELPANCGVQYAIKLTEYLGCSGGWTFSGGRCYLYVDEWLTWDQCLTHCTRYGDGATLARVYNVSAFDVLIGITYAGWRDGFASTAFYYPWVGVHDKLSESEFMDAQNQPIPSNVRSRIYYNDGSNDCGYARTSSVRMSECDNMWNCICEMDPRILYGIPGLS